MPLIQFVVILVVVGVILWLVNTYIPMNGTIKGILNVIVIIAVIVFALNTFGLLDGVRGLRIGR
jgi:UDP-N-acetylmuramyl pentapeptide phosphotransferase/UDP-N-acetylglucosamine-1-phosphate transferase